jgi:hypothetical protein
MRSLFMFVVIALAAAEPVSARTHRPAKPVPLPAASPIARSENVPEQNRDPADIALDKRIKGICRGC